MTRPFDDIAARLRWHRELLGLDQKGYAEQSGVSPQQISNAESGNYRLGLNAALQLRRKHGLSLDFIYEGIADALPMNLRNAWAERSADK